MCSEFIETASKRVGNERMSPVCTVKTENNEVVIIDSDEEGDMNVGTNLKDEAQSVNTTIAENESPNETVLTDKQIENTPSQQQPNETLPANECQPSTSGMRVKRAKYVPANLQCGACALTFPSQRSLIYHQKMHLNNVPNQCRICLRGLSTKSEKEVHERKCRKRRYECFLCHYTSGQLRGLVDHMCIHTGERRHKCAICKTWFQTAGNLRAHRGSNTHEQKLLLKQGQCNENGGK